MAERLGTVFVELDLDYSKFEKGQIKILNASKQAGEKIEQNWRVLGAKSDQIYQAMANGAINAYNKISAEATASAAEQFRAQSAMVHKINTLNKKMLDNPLYKTLGVRSEAAINDQKKAIISSYETIKNSGRATAQDLINIERAKNTKLAALDRERIHQVEKTNQMSLAAMTRAVLRLYAAYFVLSKAARVLFKPFMKGFKAVEDYNRSVASMAAMVMTFAEQDPTKNIAENWKVALGYAKSIIPVIETIAAKTIMSGQETVALANAFARAGVFLDENNQSQIKAFMALSNALPLLTQGQEIMRQINTEIRATMTGANAQSSMLLQTLRAQDDELDKHLEQWRKTDTVLEEIGKMLNGFGEATALLENQWETVSSELDTIVTQILRGGMVVAYDTIIGQVKELNKLLESNKYEFIVEIATAVNMIVTAVEYLGKALKPVLWIVDKLLTLVPFVKGLQELTKEWHSNTKAMVANEELINRINAGTSDAYKIRGKAPEEVANDIVEETKAREKRLAFEKKALREYELIQLEGQAKKLKVLENSYNDQLAIAAESQADTEILTKTWHLAQAKIEQETADKIYEAKRKSEVKLFKEQQKRIKDREALYEKERVAAVKLFKERYKNRENFEKASRRNLELIQLEGLDRELKALEHAHKDQLVKAEKFEAINVDLITAYELKKAKIKKKYRMKDAADALAEQERLIKIIDKGFDDYRKKQEKDRKDQEKALDEQEKANKQMLDRVQSYTEGIFYDLYSGNIDGWEDMLGRMKDLFFRYMAEMTARALAQPIILPIVQSITGGMGNLASGLGLGSVMGGSYGGGLGGILNTSVGMNPFSTAGGVDAGLNSFFGASGMTYGQLLGAGAMGGLGYSLIGGALGLPQSKYSGLGGAAGGMGGFALGSQFGAFGGPIGMGIGALAGGLLGSVFGGEDEKEIRMKKKRINLLTGELDFSKDHSGGLKDEFRYIRDASTAVFEAAQDSMKSLLKVMPKEIGDDVQSYLSTHTFKIPGMEIGFDKDAERRMEKYQKEVGERINKLIDQAFMSAGFVTTAALDVFMEKMKVAGEMSVTTMAGAFAAAVETNDFNAFGMSIKDTVYQNVTDGVLEALMQSEMFQSALSPIFYGLQNAMDKSFASGEFNLNQFMELATPYLGQVNNTIAQLQPAFDFVSGALMDSRNLIYQGTAPATGIQQGDIDYGTTASVTMNVNGVITTDDAETWLGRIIQNLQDKGIGDKFSNVKTTSAGLN